MVAEPGPIDVKRSGNWTPYILLFLLLALLLASIVLRLMNIGHWRADIPETVFIPMVFFAIRYLLDLCDRSLTKERAILSTGGNVPMMLFFLGYATSEPVAITLTLAAAGILAATLVMARRYVVR